MHLWREGRVQKSSLLPSAHSVGCEEKPSSGGDSLLEALSPTEAHFYRPSSIIMTAEQTNLFHSKNLKPIFEGTDLYG